MCIFGGGGGEVSISMGLKLAPFSAYHNTSQMVIRADGSFLLRFSSKPYTLSQYPLPVPTRFSIILCFYAAFV